MLSETILSFTVEVVMNNYLCKHSEYKDHRQSRPHLGVPSDETAGATVSKNKQPV